MNNQDFKNLLLSNAAKSHNASQSTSTPRAQPTPGGSLGSRQRASIPMTPRTVMGGSAVDFQRQLAEQRAGDRPAKKFKSSAAPKGSRLASGYTDRTQDRVDEEADDRARRIKALEESYKLGQIDQSTFEQLRDQITGGDVSATHLVKGLDRKLLERVRRGEDVLGVRGGSTAAEKEPEPDVDDEFEKLEDREIAPVVKERKEKKGQTALAGTKRTRDEILAELKAQRKAAAEAKAAAQPQLGSKFRKIGHKNETFPRIERDDKGREVLITLDEDGNVKRKVRKVKADAEQEEKAPSGLLMPDKDAKPLGMEVPELPKAPPEDDDDDGDIFEGVGDSYDPLAGLGDDDSSSSEDEDGEVKGSEPAKPKDISKSPSSAPEEPESTAMPPPPKPSDPLAIPKTNYFKDSPSIDTSATSGPPSNPLTDPTILAAIRKARDINPEKLRGEDDEGSARKDPEEEARLKKRAAMLSLQDRDMDDMDMGFGSSRFDDAEDMDEDTKIKLSEWKGMGGGDDDDGEGKRERGGKQRKRGGKKRKGDKDSAADVMRVMEQRKSGGNMRQVEAFIRMLLP
ncbi:Red-like protein [Neofusicoccum parvum]|uniref:Red-like protein n=1 Tax=Neofusicoccum parvum TaxID=310453 RepID=A0ACB5SDL9_9PEZI|nr:Red-like protein [Neofusicoccum parvum]